MLLNTYTLVRLLRLYKSQGVNMKEEFEDQA